ncbi:MAG: hypothetical protein HUU38_24910 [Anaerolineales bacterium]|nr:hypothetical protein [Anaerolineales bacterium]
MDVAMDKDQKKMLGLGLVAAVMFLFMRIDPSDVRAAGRWFKQGHWLAPTLVVVTVISSGFVGVKGYRLKKQRQAQAEITERIATGPTVLLLPRSDWKPVDPLKVNLWGRLADALPHDEQVSLEVFGNGLEIAFALHASENGLRAALTQIKAEWPGIQRRTVSDDPTHLPEGWAIYWCECVPAVWDRPVTSITPDPLRAALVELNAVMGRGRGMLQIIAKNDFGTKRKVGQKAVQARGEGQKMPHAGVKALRTKEARALESRFDRSFLQVTIRAVGMADTPQRAQGIARGLARAICASYGPQNPLKVRKEGQNPLPIQQRTFGQKQAWADHELATLGHLVGSDMLTVAPRLKVASAKSLPVSPVMCISPGDAIARFEEHVS